MSWLLSSTRVWPAVDRRWTVLALGVGLVAASVVVGLGLGAVNLSPSQVWRGLLGETDSSAHQIVWNLRLPRVILAAMVGANLALAGGILQGITRNPLTDPHLLGFSAGAGLAAVAGLLLMPSFALEQRSLLAVAGALVAGLIIYLASWRGGVAAYRFTLTGVAVAAFLTAFTSAMLVTSSLTVPAVMAWLLGGLYGRGWPHVDMLWPYWLGGSAAALLLARQVNVMSLDEEVAIGLGVRIVWLRLLLTALVALLAGSAVSVAGLIGFVGLIIPHMARFLVGADYRYVLPTAGLLGAALLVLADTVARTLLAPEELPVGILTAALGAPYFIYLLRRRL
ncbi:MAG TPA: iron ABC transporter permease [Dehalococcoidia bacterium]|nr:iron ABC transporter permease [Dehalococcoidia bacterium]